MAGKLVLFFIVGLFLSGCNYSILKSPQASVPPSSNYAQSELSYALIYQRILKPSCISCHGSSGGVNLESYAAVKSHINSIFDSTIIKRTMPKAPTSELSEYQLGLLNAWIEAGAPEVGMDSELPPEPSLEPTFQSIKSHILDTKCLTCHAPGKEEASIPLVTKEDLLNSPLDIVIPGNSEESGLILVLTGVMKDKLMPPPKDSDGNPTGFSKLSDSEIQVVREWIDAGAND